MKETMEITDECLIHKYREGNEKAAEILYCRYWPKVYRLAAAYLKSHTDAEDIAQSVLIKVILEKKLLTFKGKSLLWSWLYRITLNACKSYQRKSKPTVAIHVTNEEALDSLRSNKIKDPEALAIEAEESKLLRQAVERLTPAYRRGIEVVCLEEDSYAEGAKILSIPQATLGVHVMRAKEKLAQWFLADPSRGGAGVQPKGMVENLNWAAARV